MKNNIPDQPASSIGVRVQRLVRLNGALPELIMIGERGGRYQIAGRGPLEWSPHEESRVEAWNAYAERHTSPYEMVSTGHFRSA